MSHASLPTVTLRPAIALALFVAACSQQPAAITTNVRQAGEPTTVSRELTPAEQDESVAAMRSSSAPGQSVRPLASAGASGRWREVGPVAVAAAKRCEVAVVRERPVSGGKAFDLRSIADQPGEMRVMGDEARGVTGVTVTMGLFDEQRELADRVREAFFVELRRASAIPRPQ